jgi:endo-1,4-beta-D-glucanase Y
MKRRSIIMGAMAVMTVSRASVSFGQSPDLPHPLAAVWDAWKAAYMEPNGRVVDLMQGGASHSESQGYGLLLAATMQDADAFNTIDDWTIRHLRIRQDNLLAWRWLPQTTPAVPDNNNASDGDLFYAWALIRAAKAFDRPALTERATAIARDLSDTCIQNHPDGSGRLVLTPAATGFQRDTGLIWNPSYLMPLAMEDVADATGTDRLRIAARDGISILDDLASLGLVPDWVELRAEGSAPVAGMTDANGYEAMRTPLFLIWSGMPQHLAVMQQARAYGAANTVAGSTPTVMDRLNGRVLEVSDNPGYSAVSGLVGCAVRANAGSFMPSFDPSQPYYPATLQFMTLLAQIETLPRCVPL